MKGAAMKKIVMFIIVSMFIPTIKYAKHSAEPDWIKNIPAGKVIEWRRHIHQYPELTFKETNTSNYVAEILKKHFGNIEIIRPTETSVIGILRSVKPGSIVAFRADLDALPIQERKPAFRSLPQ